MSPLARAAAAVALLWPALISATPALAEKSEVSLLAQNGLPFLPFMVMEHERLIEQEAEKSGLGQVKVTWDSVTGPTASMELILSGQRDIAGAGPPSLITMWAKTRGTPQEVMGMSGIQWMPLYLLTRNPKVKTLADLSEEDRIAVPSVKVSSQAMALEMAAAQEFGKSGWDKLDRYTVSLAHPDAVIAMLGGKSEINGHVSVAPYYYDELKDPAIRKVMRSYDVYGEPHTNGLLMTTTKFYRENPKLYAAVIAAEERSIALIKGEPRRAAEIYLEMAKDRRHSVEELTGWITDPEIVYTTTPRGIMKIAQFMHDAGRLPDPPRRWQDLFLPNAHELPGS